MPARLYQKGGRGHIGNDVILDDEPRGLCLRGGDQRVEGDQVRGAVRREDEVIASPEQPPLDDGGQKHRVELVRRGFPHGILRPVSPPEQGLPVDVNERF